MNLITFFHFNYIGVIQNNFEVNVLFTVLQNTLSSMICCIWRIIEVEYECLIKLYHLVLNDYNVLIVQRFLLDQVIKVQTNAMNTERGFFYPKIFI